MIRDQRENFVNNIIEEGFERGREVGLFCLSEQIDGHRSLPFSELTMKCLSLSSTADYNRGLHVDDIQARI